MCPPSFRFALLPCLLCFVLIIVLQQRCLSAALRPSPSLLHDDSDDDDDGAEDRGEVVREEGGDKNITNARMMQMEKKIETLELQMRELLKYVSKQQREKCAKQLCPVGAVKYGCDCLMYVHKSLTWLEARDYCASMTGKMVNIATKGLHKHITKFLRAQLGQRGTRNAEVFTGLIYTSTKSQEPFYTGVHRSEGKGDGWYWHNLTKVTKLGSRWHNWAEGYPPSLTNSSAALMPSCMFLDGSRKLKWKAVNCNTRKTFICHFKTVPARNKRKRKREEEEEEAGGRRRRRRKKKRKRHRARRHNHKKQCGDKRKCDRDNEEEELENG